MTLKFSCFFFLLLVCSFFRQPLLAQSECQPPIITANANTFNIFNDRQETDLGDAVAERVRKDFRVIDDEQINLYLQGLGDRIVKHLPQTNLKFQFVVVDLPEANAFNMSGGRIYVTRKLLAFVNSEDELAGVLAHELGHGVVHHSAIDLSKRFKEILGITEVGDRRDIFEKYNQLIENSLTKNVKFKTNHEDNQQLEADRIGIFAATAAGYDPNGLITFLDRLTESKGKTGNFFTDIFGATKPAQKRLREMINALKSLPSSCFEKRAVTTENTQEFEKWRTFVIAYSGLGGKERLNGVISRKTLAPPLRTDVEYLRFSPNGEYILAQDDSGISILKREPFTLLFRIEAPEVKPANFTPDSHNVVFYNTGLRVQVWSIADQAVVSVDEVVLRSKCWQSALSPDGKTLACYSYLGDLGLYDVATNENIFLDKQFYLPTYYEYFVWLISLEYGDDEVDVMNMQFSPDAHYFVAGRRKMSGNTLGIRREANIGVDVTSRKKVSIGGNIGNILAFSCAFFDNDKIIGQTDYKGEGSGVFSFPKGERIEKLPLLGKTMTRAEKGDYLLIRPVSNAPVGVYDVSAKKFILANKTPALDIYGDTFVSERKNGELGLYKFKKGEKLSVEQTTVLELPPNQFGTLRTVKFSPDGKWLVASEKSRGAVWNVQTGERVLYLLGFRGNYFGADNLIYADVPKNEQTERTIISMSPTARIIESVNVVSEKNTRQFGQFLVSFKSNKEKPKEESEKESEKKSTASTEERVFIASKDVTMEIRDTQSNAVLWTRRFDEERPTYGFNQTDGTLTFVWRLQSKAAKHIIKEDTTLSAKMGAMKDKEGDYLFQFVEPKTGKLTGQFLLETGEGSFDISDVFAAGDKLIISDTTNRVLVYSISQGNLLQRFFGGHPTINLEKNIIVIENESGQLAIYNLTTGAERDKLYFGKPISFVQLSPDGKRLFVLTANQTAFMLDTTKFAFQSNNDGK